jgi:hypothetical protein
VQRKILDLRLELAPEELNGQRRLLETLEAEAARNPANPKAEVIKPTLRRMVDDLARKVAELEQELADLEKKP